MHFIIVIRVRIYEILTTSEAQGVRIIFYIPRFNVCFVFYPCIDTIVVLGYNFQHIGV